MAFAPLSLCLKTARRANPREENEAHQAALILGPRCVPCTRRAQPGAEIWTPLSVKATHIFFHFRAIALWAWSNFLHGSSSPGVCKVQINFDETGVCLFQDSTRGHMVAATRARKRPASPSQET